MTDETATPVATKPEHREQPARHYNSQLDAEWIYDLGYARGVREALATLRLTADQRSGHSGH